MPTSRTASVISTAARPSSASGERRFTHRVPAPGDEAIRIPTDGSEGGRDHADKILAVGEVLWDLLPSGKQLGGAPANFTYPVPILGADARLVTRVGDDDLGREVLDRFRSLGLPTEHGPGRPRVRRRGPSTWPSAPDGQPRFTIRERRRLGPDRGRRRSRRPRRRGRRRLLRQPRAAGRAVATRDPLAGRGGTPPAALRMFDVNLRPPFVDRDVIEESLALANALKLNDQELPALAAMFGLAAERREVDGGAGPTGSACRWSR